MSKSHHREKLGECIMSSITRFFFFIIIIFLLCFALTSQGIIALAPVASGYEFYHAERDDLLELRDSLSSSWNLHSRWTGPPCYKDKSRWIGITCSNSHVIGINLHGIQLTGSLQPTALQNVAYLTSLTLSDNALHGNLPTLKGLVYLQNVSFSGNRFSGSIPVEYAALPNLTLLELQDNLLNGTIPPFAQQSLSIFNVSYNFLQGKIPETPVLQRFLISSYAHNLELCGRPLNKACPAPAPAVPIVHPPPPSPSSFLNHSGPKRLELWGLILVAVGAVLVPVMVIFCFLCYYKRNHRNETVRKGENSGEVSSDFPVKKARGPGARDGANRLDGLEFFDKSRAAFDLDSLLRSSAEVLGKGKLGTTYRATHESGPVVVVKRLREVGGVSRREFVQQMQLLGTLRYEKVVEIVACYYSKDERLVIYENVPDGSLAQLLHDNRGEGRVPLNWHARLTIVKGIAKGVAYLHHSLPSQRVPHANLKSSNILIHRNNQHQYHPKLTDFGFLPLLHSPQQAQKLAIGRTPELSQGKRLNHKADIYCLGLVLLEIITGHAPEEQEGGLPAWVTSVIRNEWSTEIFDLEIVAEREHHEQMLRLTDIALQCTALEPGRRPNISVVVERIEEINDENNGQGT